MAQPKAPVRFHLAFPVDDLAQAKAFYLALGCTCGRSSDQALILNLAGHQIVAHLSHQPLTPQQGIYPRHFGLVFEAETDWLDLLHRAESAQLKFYQGARLRFAGSPLEHRTFFLEDPSRNLLEFKFYRNAEAIFGAQEHSQVGDTATLASL
jgi:extradiol dioxygenase family protein